MEFVGNHVDNVAYKTKRHHDDRVKLLVYFCIEFKMTPTILGKYFKISRAQFFSRKMLLFAYIYTKKLDLLRVYRNFRIVHNVNVLYIYYLPT